MLSSRRFLSNSALSRKEQFVQNVTINGDSTIPSRYKRGATCKSSVLKYESTMYKFPVPVVEIGPSSFSSSSSFDRLSIVLTKRSSLLRAHRGEICFPGGKCDEGETLEKTALRETHEETGMEESKFDVWSRLEPVLTSRFDRAVMPIVAELKDSSILDQLNPNYDEVEYVFSVPLSHLVSNLSYTLFIHPKFKYRLPLFHVNQFTIHAHSKTCFIPRSLRIWGLSAIILHQTLSHLSPSTYNAFKAQFY